MRPGIMQLQRLTNSKVCSQQVRDPEEKKICFQFDSEVWELEVLCMHAQLCSTLCDRMGNLSGSSVHGIFQGRTLERVAIFSSRGSSQPRD